MRAINHIFTARALQLIQNVKRGKPLVWKVKRLLHQLAQGLEEQELGMTREQQDQQDLLMKSKVLLLLQVLHQ